MASRTGHRLAAVVAQRALLVEFGPVARAHEAAVAHEQWRLVGQRLGERRHDVAMAGAAQDDLGERRRRRATRPRARRAACPPATRPDPAVAQGGEVARAAASDRQALQGAFDIRHAPQRFAHPLARPPVARRRAAPSRAGARSRPVRLRGAAMRSASRRAPGPVRVRSMVASRLPSRRPSRLFTSSRLRRVAGSISIVPSARSRRRRHQGRALAGLGQLDIVEQRPQAATSRPREGTETVEHGDVEGRLRRLLAGIDAVEPRRGAAASGRQFHSSSAVLSGSRASSRSGTSSSPGASAPARPPTWPGSSGWVAKSAVDEIEPGQRQLALGLGQRREVVVAARIEQRVLGQGAGRDDAHHGTLDHRLGATFLGLGRVLDLFADRDLKLWRIRRDR